MRRAMQPRTVALASWSACLAILLLAVATFKSANGEERRTTEHHIGATGSSPSWTVEVATVYALEARELTFASAQLVGGNVLRLTDDDVRFWVVPVKVINRRRDVLTARLNSNWFLLEVGNVAGKSTVLTPSGTKDFPGTMMWTDLALNQPHSLELLYVVAGVPKDMVLDFVDVRLPLLQAGFPVSSARTPAEATAFSSLVQRVRTGLKSPDSEWNPGALRTRLKEADLAKATAVVMHEGNWEARLRGVELLREIADQTAVRTLIDTLKDPEHLVRAAAAEALGVLKDKSAVRPLVDLLEQEEYLYVLKPAARALGAAGTSEAIEALRRLGLRTDDAETREIARQAIAEIQRRR